MKALHFIQLTRYDSFHHEVFNVNLNDIILFVDNSEANNTIVHVRGLYDRILVNENSKFIKDAIDSANAIERELQQ